MVSEPVVQRSEVGEQETVHEVFLHLAVSDKQRMTHPFPNDDGKARTRRQHGPRDTHRRGPIPGLTLSLGKDRIHQTSQIDCGQQEVIGEVHDNCSRDVKENIRLHIVEIGFILRIEIGEPLRRSPPKIVLPPTYFFAEGIQTPSHQKYDPKPQPGMGKWRPGVQDVAAKAKKEQQKQDLGILEQALFAAERLCHGWRKSRQKHAVEEHQSQCGDWFHSAH